MSKPKGNYITCAFCGTAGGTLMKIGEGKYVHQDRVKCAVLASKSTIARSK